MKLWIYPHNASIFAIRIGALPDSDLIAAARTLHAPCLAQPDYIAKHGCPFAAKELVNYNCLSAATLRTVPGLWCFDGVNRSALPVRGNLRTNDTNSCYSQPSQVLVLFTMQAGWWATLLYQTLYYTDKISSAKFSSPSKEFYLPCSAYAGALTRRQRRNYFISRLRSRFSEEPAHWDLAIANNRTSNK